MRQHRCPQVRLIHTSSLPHQLCMHEWAMDTHHCFPFYRMSRARSIASMLSGTSAFTRISHGADTFLFLGRMKRSCQKRLTAWTKPKDIAVWALRGNLRSNARQTSSYVDVYPRQQHGEHRRTRHKANGNSLQINRIYICHLQGLRSFARNGYFPQPWSNSSTCLARGEFSAIYLLVHWLRAFVYENDVARRKRIHIV